MDLLLFALYGKRWMNTKTYLYRVTQLTFQNFVFIPVGVRGPEIAGNSITIDSLNVSFRNTSTILLWNFHTFHPLSFKYFNCHLVCNNLHNFLKAWGERGNIYPCLLLELYLVYLRRFCVLKPRIKQTEINQSNRCGDCIHGFRYYCFSMEFGSTATTRVHLTGSGCIIVHLSKCDSFSETKKENTK